jgi:dTDP-4-amino-4,6-dideoxygalactose transaminase
VQEVLYSGQLAHGPRVDEFERGLAAYLGAPHLISAGDVSSALAIALYHYGVRPGSEVIASPMACLATNMPISQLFARAVWCDIDPTSGSISPTDIERKITADTRAILVYHWAGNPVDVAPIYEIGRRHRIAIIEDCGEALGAEMDGVRLGGRPADAAVFSFYPNRHITTGEGAAISFARAADADRARWLRRYSIHQPSFRRQDGEISRTCDIPDRGFNSYLTQIAAAIGLTQLPALPDIVDRHQANGAFYDAQFSGIPGIRVLSRPPKSKSAYWVYTLLAERSDALLAKLHNAGIGASRVHLRNDLYSIFGAPSDPLPGVDLFDRDNLSIPSGWWLTDEERGAVVDCVRSGW